MRFPTLTQRVVVAAALAIAMPAFAGAPPSAERLSDLSATIQSLLDAHARTADAAAPTEAARQRAAALLDKGLAQLSAKDLSGADTSLHLAYNLATELVVGASGGQRLVSRRPDQYAVKASPDREKALVQARVEAVRSLLDAYRRVGTEKQMLDESRAIAIENKLTLAAAHVTAGSYGDARRLAEGAYEQVAAMVAAVRNGDTLVKSLTFDTAADEYRYELDRNDSYRMLLQLAVAERSGESAGFVEREAEALRLKAEEAGAGGRYPDGVRLLEQSTERLAQGIRATGRFLP